MIEGLFQPAHLLVIALVALFVFGPKRLPELGKGLGGGLRALKQELRDVPGRTATEDDETEAQGTEGRSLG
jgi:sec-independent protein translocase protein TatA